MGSRYEVEVSVTSAKDLKNVNWRHGKLRPYAVVWVDPANKCSTRVDEAGDTNPVWDERLTIPFTSPIDESTLFIDVVHVAAAEEDKTKPLIGSAKLPLRDIVDAGGRLEKKLELKRPSGRPHGKIEVQVSVREPRHYPPADPYSAHPYGVPPPGTRDYPAPAYETAYSAPHGYAPPAYGQTGYAQPAYGSGYYGQPGYGGQGGYNYGQPAVTGEGQKKSGSKFGGMGTGLAVGAVAGVVGGIALAEGYDALEDKITDDAAERVEDDLEDEYGDGGEDGDF